MKTRLVNYERRNNAVSMVRSTIEYIAKTANTKQEAVSRLSEILPNTMKIGFGGSHVWCSRNNGDRLFIIYF